MIRPRTCLVALWLAVAVRLVLPACPQALADGPKARAGSTDGVGGVEAWHANLARHWAPAIFQAVAVGDRNPLGRYDFLASVEFDGDLAGGNNWENSDDSLRQDFPLRPYVYYAVLETETHYYITYSLFHPRDWTWNDLPALTHENDLESATLVVLKQGRFGALRALGTVCHLNNYCLIAAPDIEPRAWALDAGGGDAAVRYYEDRPCLFVESGGHGIGGINRALAVTAGGPYAFGDRRYGFAGGAGVVYLASDDPGFTPEGEPVAAGQAGEGNFCRYQLIPLVSSLWPLRAALGPGMMFDATFTYRSPGGCSLATLPVFLAAGDQDVGANPPWARKASGDDLGRGVWFLDPAYAFDHYITTWQDRDLPGYHRYLVNPYVAGDLELEVTLPSGGRPLVAGYPAAIRWQAGAGAEALLERAEVLLSRNGGRTWTMLPASASLAAREATWTVDGPSSGRCLVALRAPFACERDLAVVGWTPTFSIAGAGVLDWIQLSEAEWSSGTDWISAPGIYDAREDRMVVASGASGAPCRVWAFHFTDMDWEALGDTADGAPSWRDRPVVAYDSDRRRLILCGGEAADRWTGRTQAAEPNAVWLYSLAGRAWSRVAAVGGDPRTEAAGIFDPTANRLVIFGGSTGDSARNDVRALELPDDPGSPREGFSASPLPRWETLHDGRGTAPAPRVGAVGVYDTASGRLFVHGGRTGVVTQPGQTGEPLPPREVALADLWAFDLAAGEWKALSDGTIGCPGARWHHAGLIDAARSQVVIYGGQDAAGRLADTWAFDLENSGGSSGSSSGWRLLNDGLDSDSPGPRALAVAALRAPRGQLIVCGGGDVWSLAFGRGGPGPDGGEGVARDSLPVLEPGLWPNPARSEINVSFSLAKPARVKVAFYDATGRLVRVLRDADTQAGLHSLWWNGRDGENRRVSEGIYFCRIAAEGLTWTRPAVLLW
jgi:hypothetical protein